MRFLPLLLAAALPLPAFAQSVAFGLGEAHAVDSKVLGESRRVFVHAPPGCESGGLARCAVLVTLDGEAQFAHTVTTSASCTATAWFRPSSSSAWAPRSAPAT